jgi:hypothetical protein
MKAPKVKKTKHGDYETRVLFPVFSDYDILIVFTEDFNKSWDARFTSSLGTPEVTTAFHWHHKPSDGRSRMFFKLGDCPTGVIAHESWHCVRTMLIDWVGCALEEEVVAYHLDYLVQAVTDFRNKLIDQKIVVKSVKSSKKKR